MTHGHTALSVPWQTLWGSPPTQTQLAGNPQRVQLHRVAICLPHLLQGPIYETPVIPVPAPSTQSRQHTGASPNTPHSLVGSVCIAPVIAVPFGATASRMFLPSCCKAESLRPLDVQTHLTRALPHFSLLELCVGSFRLLFPPSDCFTSPHTQSSPRPGQPLPGGNLLPSSAPRGRASRRAPRLSGPGATAGDRREGERCANGGWR